LRFLLADGTPDSRRGARCDGPVALGANTHHSGTPRATTALSPEGECGPSGHRLLGISPEDAIAWKPTSLLSGYISAGTIRHGASLLPCAMITIWANNQIMSKSR
jgi:hypothetical protein